LDSHRATVKFAQAAKTLNCSTKNTKLENHDHKEPSAAKAATKVT
jgi:hypothetical protein